MNQTWYLHPSLVNLIQLFARKGNESADRVAHEGAVGQRHGRVGVRHQAELQRPKGKAGDGDDQQEEAGEHRRFGDGFFGAISSTLSGHKFAHKSSGYGGYY